MKKVFFFTQIFLLLFVVSALAGTFNSGSTGADGAFNPTADTELQLPANGIFNYTTVNIPSGVTVTFKKNAANTPVYVLATGDVTIAGTISVNGGAIFSNDNNPGSGGPGGYDGGWGGVAGLSNGAGGKGLGPGGGGGGSQAGANHGGGGGFGTVGTPGNGAGGSTYGNERLIPLIGGSGGGGSGAGGPGGGGGGGAILIASSGTITISGSITSNGGSGHYCCYYTGGGGSGGAIRLIANTIKGSGVIYAYGGQSGITGGSGRIRLEAYTNSFASATSPAYSYGFPGPVFVSNQPSLMITSIAGVNVPASPTGSYASPDIALPSTTANPVAVGLSALNIPVGTIVTVSVIPQHGSSTNVTTTLSGTDSSSTATASVDLSTTYASVILAQATFTLQTAMYWDGERIEKVRVAATIGKGSETVYITESGKEIKAEKLMAMLVE